MKNKKQTLLWKISSDKTPGDSYVFGTMHVRDKDAFQYRDLVFEKIDACDAFATEFNLEEMEHNVSANLLDLKEGETLDILLSKKQYEKANKVFQKVTGMDLELFNSSQPILVANLMAGKMLSEEMPHSLDETLWQYAREQEKLVLGVETYSEQISILLKIPLDYQVKNLMSIVKNLSAYKKGIKKMTKLYKKADIQQLYKSVKKSSKGMRKLLLYNRNEIMAERIAEMATEQSICVAIGAGHLGGSKGVLRLLKKRGFIVRPVPGPQTVADVPAELETE
ncbi:MAG: TraB/GumN family protein [Saprospiraceae bacterium]